MRSQSCILANIGRSCYTLRMHVAGFVYYNCRTRHICLFNLILDVNRRQLLGTVGIATLAGCLGSVPGFSQCSDPYEWCHPVPGRVYAASGGQVFGIEDAPPERSSGIDRWGLFGPERNGSVFGLDTETGTEQWTYGTSHGYEWHSRLHAEDAVYTEWGDDAGGGQIHVLEFDGTKRWQAGTGYINDLHMTSDLLYVAAGDLDYSIHVLDKATGDRQWHYPFPEQQDRSYSARPSLTYTDELLYIGWEELFTVDTSDYSISWTYGTEHERVHVSAVVDEVAFVRTDSGVAAVADGQELWTQPIDGNFSIITVTSDAVIVRQRSDGIVRAFSVETGELQWSSEPTLPGSTRTAHSGTTAYIADGQSILAVNMTTGDHKWDKELNHERSVRVLWVPDESDEEGVYVSSDETHLQHVNDAGETTWEQTFDGEIQGEGVLTDDLLVIGTDTGIYASKQP